jgi:hypothetical protein
LIVRERGESWQLVRQPDHADLAGQLAEAWGGGEFARPTPLPSVVLAAFRHDDGWAIFDRRPAWDSAKGQPLNFLDIPIRVHVAFYSACIEVVAEEDPYAGVLVSMHAVGLYNGRYDTSPGSGPGFVNAPNAAAEVVRFVAEREAAHTEQAKALRIPEEERWANYKLLQIYDRLSLAFCLREWESSEAEPYTLAPAPSDYAGTEVELTVEPLGPWRVRMTPYPFVESPARFTLVRKLLLQAPFGGNEEFRAAFFATRAEMVEITAVS